ncbi:MAG: hypothetical protein IJT07_04600 [Oscillospiraceae bacterium]|nr:hypothetical protein [Oscillospiraceae bacterium]
MEQRNALGKLLARIPFRKRGSSYLYALTFLFSAAIVIYVFSGILDGLSAPLRTVQAVEVESGIGCSLHGTVVREEQTLSGIVPLTAPTVAEGQKVARGQTVAMGYTDAAARQRHSRIIALQNELIELESADAANATTLDQASMDAEIRSQLFRLAGYLNRHDLSGASRIAPSFKGVVLRRNASEADLAAIAAQAASCRAELDNLLSVSESETFAVEAPFGGYFSETADGLETVLTPDGLSLLTPSALAQIQPLPLPANTIGKLIRGETWYYAAPVSTEDIGDLAVGKRATVTFDGIGLSCTMTVRSVGQAENGRCVLVLSCSYYLPRMTAVRQADAELQFDTIKGLRVPKEAVHVSPEGEVGVFVLESAVMKWKAISILHDNGESYTVQLDRSSTQNLWPGDEIILSTEELYNGKVVYE